MKKYTKTCTATGDNILKVQMHMDRVYSTVYLLLLLLPTVYSRRHLSSARRNLMAFRDPGTSSYISCCYVDIFCYTTCFGGPGGSLRALVPEADGGSLRTSDSGRHRHRHRHGDTQFRSKREVNKDNKFWRKIR